ncbi:hypothetical protein MKX01_020740 [Papaver californicum]|nr:hypothetical protein MKX01_020740 [Papaver californicum]
MSFDFRGTRGDIESGFPGFIPERRQRVHAGRPVNTNSVAFLLTVLLLFMILNTHQMSHNFLVFNTNGDISIGPAQAQAHAAAASGLLGHTELRLQMPPSIAFATRGRLEGLRLQLALLDKDFDDLGMVTHCFSYYKTLRALDSDNGSSAQSLSEEEINASLESSTVQQASSSAMPEVLLPYPCSYHVLSWMTPSIRTDMIPHDSRKLSKLRNKFSAIFMYKNACYTNMSLLFNFLMLF